MMIAYNTPSNLMFKNVKREVEDVKKWMSNSLIVAGMYFTNKFLTTDLESVLKIPGDNSHLIITFLIFQKFLQDYQCSRRHFMMT